MRPEAGAARTRPAPASRPRAGRRRRRRRPPPLADAPRCAAPAATPRRTRRAGARAARAGLADRARRPVCSRFAALPRPARHRSTCSTTRRRVAGTSRRWWSGCCCSCSRASCARGKRRAWEACGRRSSASPPSAHVLSGPDPSRSSAVAMVVALAVEPRRVPGPARPGLAADVVRFVPLYLGPSLVFGFGTLLLEREPRARAAHVGGMLETTFWAGRRSTARTRTRAGSSRTSSRRRCSRSGSPGWCRARCSCSGACARRADARTRELARARSCAPTAPTRSTTSRCGRTRATSSRAAGDAMVAFTYVSGYALVAGRPDRRAGGGGAGARRVPGVLPRARLAGRRSWRCARPTCRSTERRGFREVYLGDEAIIPCDRFTLAAAMKSVRAAVSAGSAATATSS